MEYLANPGAVVNVVAGLTLAAMGAYVLRLRPRTRTSVAFSAFAILWGLQVGAANMYDMSVSVGAGTFWLHAFLLLLIPLYLPLLYFVSAHPSPSNSLGRSPVALAVAGVPAVVLVLLFVAWPEVLVRDVQAVTNSLQTVYGPLYWPLTVVNALVAFAVALALVLRNLFNASAGLAQRQFALVAAALLTYLSYRAADLVWIALVLDPLLSDAGAIAVGIHATGAAAAALVTGIGLLRVSRSRDVPLRALLIACATVPLAVGILEVVLRTQAGVTGFRTVGLWRFVMVGLLAYAIAKYRLFDLDLRIRSSSVPVGYLGISLLGLALLWGVFGSPLTEAPLLGAMASVGLLLACYPLAQIVQAQVSRAVPADPDDAYLYRRKLEVYRVALAEASDRGLPPGEADRRLSELRRSMDITRAEHRLLVALLQVGGAGVHGFARGDATTRFKVIRELGRGSAARAILARDTVLGRDVVLKQPLASAVDQPEARERLLREARIAAKVNHPNVVSLHEILTDEDPPLLVLEHVEGGSLEDALRERGRVPVRDAVSWMRDVLAALTELHARGIIHRDLKPGNVLLDADGRAKVTDFGIAREAAADAVTRATLSATDFQPGTPGCMSPEQARGDDVSPATDVYAVGAMLYRTVTGEDYLDFAGHTPLELRQLIQDAPPREGPLADVPAPLAAVIRRALAKAPGARYGSAAEMSDALSPWASGPREAPAPREPRAADLTDVLPLAER